MLTIDEEIRENGLVHDSCSAQWRPSLVQILLYLVVKNKNTGRAKSGTKTNMAAWYLKTGTGPLCGDLSNSCYNPVLFTHTHFTCITTSHVWCSFCIFPWYYTVCSLISFDASHTEDTKQGNSYCLLYFHFLKFPSNNPHSSVFKVTLTMMWHWSH